MNNYKYPILTAFISMSLGMSLLSGVRLLIG